MQEVQEDSQAGHLLHRAAGARAPHDFYLRVWKVPERAAIAAMIYVSNQPPKTRDVVWFNTHIGELCICNDQGQWETLRPDPTLWQRMCRFLFGWCIGNYWANKNDRLAAVFIAHMMNDWKISETMLARKRELWAKCEWWGRV